MVQESDISRFSISDEKLGSYVLQLTSDTDISKYPVIQEHLLKYKEIILGLNYDSGELKRAKKKGAWWALSSSRKDFNFFQPKILVPYRQKKISLAIQERNTVPLQTFFYYAKNQIPLFPWKLYFCFSIQTFFTSLYQRSKKGEMLELYKTPLEAIPLPRLSSYEHLIFDRLSKSIILLEGERYDTAILQKVGDFSIVEHYFSKTTAMNRVF